MNLGHLKFEALRALPPAATAAFAGVGNPHSLGKIELGEVVVDNLGNWDFRDKNSEIPPGNATEITLHSLGGALLTVPLQIR